MRRSRRGMLLVLVLVVVALLSLAGFRFAELMLVEHQAARFAAEQAQTQAALESGVELVRQLAEGERGATATVAGALEDPERLRGVPLVAPLPGEIAPPRFTIIAPQSRDALEGGALRFGLADESSRLNLQSVLAWDAEQPGSGREALLALPEMTPERADALLDWMDADDVPREFGVENDYYQSLERPYEPRQALPTAIDELCWVRDVPAALLLGNDRNQNGRVDAFEQGPRGEPSASGTPQHVGGWSELISLWSAEANVTADGQRRVNINGKNLRALHHDVAEVMGEAWATFVIAYRQFGPYGGTPVTSARAAGKPDFALPAKFRVASLLDLVGAQVQVTWRGGSSPTLLASPLSRSAAAQGDRLEKLLDRLTESDVPRLVGRVNVNSAPREVLSAIPGLDREKVDEMVSKRPTAGDVGDGVRRSITWLLRDQLLTWEEFRRVAGKLTDGGDVHRAQVVAQGRDESLPRRVEVVVDATSRPSRVVFWNDLSRWGRVYPREVLAVNVPPGGPRP